MVYPNREVNMITIEDIKNCGLRCNWTLLYYGVPYHMERKEVVNYAIEKCMEEDDDPDVCYLAGLTKDDAYEIDRTIVVLAEKEKGSIELAKKTIQIVEVDKALKQFSETYNGKTETEKKLQLVEIWHDCGCPPDNGTSFFGKYDYFPSDLFYKEPFSSLYKAIEEWIEGEKLVIKSAEVKS